MKTLNYRSKEIGYPSFRFNEQNGVFEISGQSFMVEAFKFYEPIFEKIKQFMDSHKVFVFNIKLQHYNTSSSKCLLYLFQILKEYKLNGKQISVNWHYLQTDIDLIEDIEDLSIEAGLCFNLIPINN